MSAIGTPTYNLAKFCDKLLKPITSNKYTIKDSFSFAKEVEEFDHNLIMNSFDVKITFQHIPYTETTGLCVENLSMASFDVKSLFNNIPYRGYWSLC